MPENAYVSTGILAPAGLNPILAAGGKRIMTALGWRSRFRVPSDARGQYLVLAYAVLAVIGMVNLIEQDLYGLALIAAAVTGVWLLQRRWFHAILWSWQILLGILGILQLDPFGLLTILIGIIGLAVGLAARPQIRLGGVVLPPPIRVSTPFAQTDLAGAPPPTANGPIAAATFTQSAVSQAPPEPAALRILTIGRLQIFVKGADVTEELTGKPMLGFVFLHLLTREIHLRGSAIRRLALAEEVSPGLPVAQQLRRLRSTLHDLQRKLPETLASRIKVEGDSVSFDPSGIELDVDWLRWFDDAVRGRTLLDPDLERRLAFHLESVAAGEFLPGWEDIEQKVNGAKGVAGELVTDVRRTVDRLRANLSIALARSYLAAGQPAKAARPLESVLPTATDRDDLQRLLVSVYQQTGQHKKAAEIAAGLRAAEEA
jgi:hypothetical protein